MKFFDVNLLTDEQKFALFYGIMLGDGCLSQYKPRDRNERFAIEDFDLPPFSKKISSKSSLRV